jgi:hypothetical protein
MSAFKGRYTSETRDKLNTSYFIREILEPSIADLKTSVKGNVEIYAREKHPFGYIAISNVFCLGSLNEKKLKKVNQRVSELDLAEITKEVIEKAQKIIKIDDRFFERENKISEFLDSKRILVDKIPSYDVSVGGASAGTCGFKIEDEKSETNFDGLVDHYVNFGGGWSASLEFSGEKPSYFVSRIFERTVAFYSKPGMVKVE